MCVHVQMLDLACAHSYRQSNAIAKPSMGMPPTTMSRTLQREPKTIRSRTFLRVREQFFLSPLCSRDLRWGGGRAPAAGRGPRPAGGVQRGGAAGNGEESRAPWRGRANFFFTPLRPRVLDAPPPPQYPHDRDIPAVFVFPIWTHSIKPLPRVTTLLCLLTHRDAEIPVFAPVARPRHFP